MNKDRFLGYLDHMKKMVGEGDYDGYTYEMIEEIIDLAEQLDEPVEQANPSPYTPYPHWPTWISYNTSEPVDEFTYNGIKVVADRLVNPNDWEIKCDNPPNFTVVK